MPRLISRSWIYIPTYQRLNRQKTLEALHPDDQKRTILVVRPEEEQEAVRIYGNVVAQVLVCYLPGVAAARQAALDDCGRDVVIMLDDDLSFWRRTDDYPAGNSRPKATKETVKLSIGWLTNNCDQRFPIVCLGPKGGNNNIEERWSISNSRVMRSFAVHKPTITRLGVRFDKFYYWEDFHVALSLLELGYENKVNVDCVTDGLTNAAGGVVRNLEKMRACIREFEKEHPTVKIREKRMFCPENGDIIVPDMTVYWKKAFRSKVK